MEGDLDGKKVWREGVEMALGMVFFWGGGEEEERGGSTCHLTHGAPRTQLTNTRKAPTTNTRAHTRLATSGRRVMQGFWSSMKKMFVV